MTKTAQKIIRWQELDILRGLAAVLMIVNHVGDAILAPSQMSGASGILVAIGSFAPVLFFFVTGVGYGIQSSKQKQADHWYIIFNKVMVLFLADQITYWSEGRWIGLDFLGFIALSSLILELIRSTNSPVAYCLAGFTSISLLRYLLVPVLKAHGYDSEHIWAWLGWIIGYNPPGVSYPLSPWLAYPFAGYIVGVAAMRYRSLIQGWRWQVLANIFALGLVPAIAGLILTKQGGSSLFRWGSVAIGFYVTSFAVLLIGLALSLAIGSDKFKLFSTALSLKGISSFAVVPIHYFIIYLLIIFKVSGLGLLGLCLLILATLVASFLLAGSLERSSQLIRRVQQQRFVWLILVATFLLMAAITLSWNPKGTFIVVLTKTIGQIVLCLLFVIRPPGLNPKVKLKMPLPKQTS